MPKEEIPINPAIVTWARERSGLTVEDAEQSFKNIEAWEAGEVFPSYPQLEQMSEAFKIPIAVFFFPSPPSTPPIAETFRTLPDAEFSHLPNQVRLLLRKGKAMQMNLAELNQGRNPAERLITRDLTFPPQIGVADMAREVREYLGIDIETQKSWEDADTALKEWRSILLKVGVYVFKEAFKARDFSGFCLYDELFPVIYVNNSASKTRQIFTIFHELAHLLFHTSGIDKIHDDYIAKLDDQSQRIEILCNEFAARFLVPEDAFSKELLGKQPTEASATQIASLFHVSREVIFRMFLSRRLITEQVYTEAAKRWAEQKKEGSGGDYYRTKIAYLGRDYISLAFNQYYRNRIDREQLAEYLDTKPKNLGALEEYFVRGGA
ncbi:ImmA/IrrE family metallo-endopeptidase [Aestuariivirga sp.]|uniref:ImmA/IrrE family metallo-endopeptidase n=1 Tax=Aestuariivirga sp. TaxID=2650926 RepID=UPI00391929D6